MCVHAPLGPRFPVLLPFCGKFTTVAEYPDKQAAATALKTALDKDFAAGPGSGIPHTLPLLDIDPLIRAMVGGRFVKVPPGKSMPPELHWIVADGRVYEAVLSRPPRGGEPLAFAEVGDAA